ncbi:hypothetical protein C0992_000368 [Termitomyces sp. T32_za158]|nr:hypothetical protein C0992_000368 [Termitomyces sp. T32_za158]
MNTTRRAPKAHINLPPLPTEIWLNILERACSAGDWNPLGLSFVTDFSLPSVRSRKNVLRKSLITKCRVVRVCKQWNVWASPYLYESLYLGRIKSLHSLRDALVRTRNSEDADTVNHASGRWTKRLDIIIRNNPSTQDDKVTCLISEIVQCLPSLSIIDFGDYQSSSSPIIRNLANTCGSTLQAVILGADIPPPGLNVWREFFEKAAHIRFLRWPRWHEVGVLSPVLPSLELLRVYDHPLLGYFPSLRHLTFDVYAHSVDSKEWKPFFKVNGMKLEVIQLNISTFHYSTLTPLFDLCPNLVRLNISVYDWDNIMLLTNDSGLKLLPKLRILGLQKTTNQSSSQMYGLLFRELKDMTCASSLSCIQFFDAGNVKDLTQKHHSMLTRELEILRKKGLELRDHEGRLMV